MSELSHRVPYICRCGKAVTMGELDAAHLAVATVAAAQELCPKCFLAQAIKEDESNAEGSRHGSGTHSPCL